MPNFISKLINLGAKDNERPYCAAVVAAAGNSARMNGIDKMFTYIADAPVIVHTLWALSDCEAVDEIIVAVRTEDILDVGRLCKDYNIQKVSKIIKGGDTRPKSVLAGINEAPQKTDIIAIHDGARPLITPDIISEAINRAALIGAAAPAVALKDTIRKIKSDGKAETLDRKKLFAIQTPQVFQYEIIKTALTKAIREDIPVTDDCEAVERIGMNVELIAGSYENIKITTPEDIKIAEAFMLGRREGMTD